MWQQLTREQVKIGLCWSLLVDGKYQTKF